MISEVWPGSSILITDYDDYSEELNNEEFAGLEQETVVNYLHYKNGNLDKLDYVDNTSSFSQTESFIRNMPDVPIIQRLFG